MTFEQYAETLQKTMADAIAQAEKLAKVTAKNRLAAINDTNRANDLVRDWEFMAQKKAAAFVEKNRKKIRLEIQNDLLRLVALQLKNSGQSPEEIAGWLDFSPEIKSK